MTVGGKAGQKAVANVKVISTKLAEACEGAPCQVEPSRVKLSQAGQLAKQNEAQICQK